MSMKQRRICGWGHVARVEVTRTMNGVLGFCAKRFLAELGKDGNQWQADLNTVMSLPVSYNGEKFLE
jgi:hypothetical protein